MDSSFGTARDGDSHQGNGASRRPGELFRLSELLFEMRLTKEKLSCKNSLDGVQREAKSGSVGGARQRPGEPMDNMSPNYRTDEQLEAIIAETGEWAVVGTNDQLLCRAASLRHAIDQALDQMFGPQTVVALVRRPSDRIVVFTDQMFRIWEQVIVNDVHLASTSISTL
jgi:hypothetical protein